MYNIGNVEGVRSYATQANAERALEKAFGPKDSGKRDFNVLMVQNNAGRFVPVLINITVQHLGALAAAGFLCVN
jgi:hypothetical protein